MKSVPRSFRSSLVLTLLFAFLSTTLPLAAQPFGPPPLEDVHQDAREYAQENGLPFAEAARRMRMQNDIGAMNAVFEADEEATYAGLYVDHTPDYRIVVQFADPYSADRVGRALGRSPMARQVEVLQVGVPMTVLKAEQAASMFLLAQLGVRADAGIDVRGNRVEVYVLDLAAAQDALVAAGLSLPEHTVLVEAADLSEVEVDIYGGLALSTCSSGFSVQDGSGTEGILTAAHCPMQISYNGTDLPWEDGAYYYQYDVQWHTAPGLTVTNEIQASCSGCRRSITGTKSRSSQFVGEYVCKRGKTTGYTCGYISDKDYQSSEPSNATATYIRVHRDGVNLSEGGDSGGPWFNSNTAYGIHHSGIGDDATYMAINYISVLGVSVLTN